jgi:hypothetical protein
MPAILGLNCKAYRNSAAAGATPVWVEATSVTSVDISNTLATADVTRRGNNGYRAQVGTLAEGSISFDLMYDTADTFFSTIDVAFRGRTTIDMFFANGPVATTGTRGFRAAFAVTDFSESQQLEDAVRFSVTLAVSGTDPTPGYYASTTGTLALVT